MNSLDTNIFIYAINSDCKEHQKAKKLVDGMLENPADWIVADQVLFELYRALRHPLVLSNPVSAKKASEAIYFIREKTGILHCSYEQSLFHRIYEKISATNFQAKKTHDTVLAISLINNGVKTFYTRNVADFKNIGFDRVINPID